MNDEINFNTALEYIQDNIINEGISISLFLKELYNEIVNNINDVIQFFDNKEIIGEITIVLKGIKRGDLKIDKLTIKKDLNDLINAGLSLSAASKYLAKKNGLKKSEIYNMI